MIVGPTKSSLLTFFVFSAAQKQSLISYTICPTSHSKAVLANTKYITRLNHPVIYVGTGDVQYLTAESCKGKDLSDVLLMPHPANWPAGFISLTNGRDATCGSTHV
jgi:hypothetical protein